MWSKYIIFVAEKRPACAARFDAKRAPPGCFPIYRGAPCARHPLVGGAGVGPLQHGGFAARGLCAHRGAGSFRQLYAGRRPQPINRPAVGRKGLPRLRRRKMKRPPWQAGRLTWGLICMMCRMRQGLFAQPRLARGISRAQGRALRLTRPGPPFCLPAHRLPPPPAQRPVHAAARRSAVVVVFALCGKEDGGNQQRQRLGRHNGKPDAVQPDKGGQRQHHGHLKHECAQK